MQLAHRQIIHRRLANNFIHLTNNFIMKKIIYILITANLLIGYVSAQNASKKMNNSLSKVYTGMTISEFKNKLNNAILVQMQGNFACYKLEERSQTLTTWSGWVYETRFLYFKDDKLYRIDEGTRATDLKIEIEKDITTHEDSKTNQDNPQYVDVVYLKNGSIIRGMIIEQIPNVSLKIQTKDGSIFV